MLAFTSDRPEQTLLYRIVDEYYPAYTAHLAEQGRELPGDVQREFVEYLKCGCLEHGFLRVCCESCHAEHLVAFSCKRRGFCPSCGARRMAESAALLVDEVLPRQPIPKALAMFAGQSLRQWVLSFPFQLRFLFARRPVIMSQVPGLRLPHHRHIHQGRDRRRRTNPRPHHARNRRQEYGSGQRFLAPPPRPPTKRGDAGITFYAITGSDLVAIQHNCRFHGDDGVECSYRWKLLDSTRHQGVLGRIFVIRTVGIRDLENR